MGSRGKRAVSTTQTELMCFNCGGKFPIHRKSYKQKPENHVKHLWCVNCKAYTKHAENIRPSSRLSLRLGGANSKNIKGLDEIDWEQVFNIAPSMELAHERLES